MKAQIQQVFIYVMAIIVIGFLVVVGGKMIFDVLDNSCSVQETQFITNLNKELSAASQAGTKHTITINAPCDHTLLCVINTTSLGKNHLNIDIDPQAQLNSVYDDNLAILKLNAKDNIPYNVYLMQTGKMGKLLPVIYDTRVTTGGSVDIVCVSKTNGAFSFRAEGLGRNGILVKRSA